MHKKIFFIVVLLYSSSVFSLTCPTVTEIQQGQLHYWLPLYKEGEELASKQDVAAFEKAITTFQLAAWDDEYLENAHCFYQGTNPILEKIVLAHDAWRPIQSSLWIWAIPNKHAECTADPTQCGFIE